MGNNVVHHCQLPNNSVGIVTCQDAISTGRRDRVLSPIDQIHLTMTDIGIVFRFTGSSRAVICLIDS